MNKDFLFGLQSGCLLTLIGAFLVVALLDGVFFDIAASIRAVIDAIRGKKSE